MGLANTQVQGTIPTEIGLLRNIRKSTFEFSFMNRQCLQLQILSICLHAFTVGPTEEINLYRCSVEGPIPAELFALDNLCKFFDAPITSSTAIDFYAYLTYDASLSER